MKPSGIVTLLTDFGTRDPFVGVMKGVVLSHCPSAAIVDLTHEIEPQRVADAAFWLAQAYRYFPPGSVHVAVVDPGVGSARKAVVLRADEQLFVGPDNGILQGVRGRAEVSEAREISLDHFGLPPPSRTFHGRDVFAPVAGLLASGRIAFPQVGPSTALLATAPIPEPVLSPGAACGEVVVIDRFGNLITNLTGPFPEGARISVIGRSVPLVATYADAASGSLLAVFGSFGQLEIAERDGSAALSLAAKRGTPVRVDW